MSNIELPAGIQGSKRARWREFDPSELLRQTIESHPNEDQADLRKIYWDTVRKHDEQTYLRAIVEYFLDNAFLALDHKRQALTRKQERPATNGNAKTGVVSAVRDRVHREAQVILMDLLMPNGKRLGDCTGTQCKKFGGWLTAVAKVAGSKRIADALSEGEVRKIWLAHNKT